MVLTYILCSALAVVAAAHSGSLSAHVPEGMCSGPCPAQSKEALVLVQRFASMAMKDTHKTVQEIASVEEIHKYKQEIAKPEKKLAKQKDLVNKEIEGNNKAKQVIAKLEKELGEQKLEENGTVLIVKACPSGCDSCWSSTYCRQNGCSQGYGWKYGQCKACSTFISSSECPIGCGWTTNGCEACATGHGHNEDANQYCPNGFGPETNSQPGCCEACSSGHSFYNSRRRVGSCPIGFVDEGSRRRDPGYDYTQGCCEACSSGHSFLNRRRSSAHSCPNGFAQEGNRRRSNTDSTGGCCEASSE